MGARARTTAWTRTVTSRAEGACPGDASVGPCRKVLLGAAAAAGDRGPAPGAGRWVGVGEGDGARARWAAGGEVRPALIDPRGPVAMAARLADRVQRRPGVQRRRERP